MPTPNPTLRREYRGAAAGTTLQNSMTNADTTFVLVSNTNWPTGAVGKFIVTINRGQADEEKVLCDTQSARTVACLLANRGFDGTTAQSHAAGATVECTISAFDADEWNQHTNATTGVHGVAGAVLGTTDAQTVTNKTIDTASGNVVKVNGNTVAASAGTATVSLPNTTDTLVGRTTTDTLTNKTLVAPVATPSAAAGVAATLQGLTSQSGDYLQAKNIGNTSITRVRSDGTVLAGMGAASGNGALEADLRTGSPTAYGLFITANASQAQAVIAAQTSTGTINFSVDGAGNITATNLTSAWTAYTPTFTNCTSASGTFRYLLVGKTLFLRANFTSGTATAAASISLTLPASLTSSASGNQLVPGVVANAFNQFICGAGQTTVGSTASLTAGQTLAGITLSGTIEVA